MCSSGITLAYCLFNFPFLLVHMQDNLVAKRGMGSENDDQVYDVAFTDNFRKYFNTILLASRSKVRVSM